MTDNKALADNIAKLNDRIRASAAKNHRDVSEITLLAVSKTRSAAEICQVFNRGINNIGENYLQEAREKQEQLSDLPIYWHFIGPIQSNKTATIAAHFDWVHSIDRLKIARRLSEQRPTALPPLNCCIQVNIDREDSKSGVSPEELPKLALEIAQLPHLKLRGLMVIPKATDNIEEQHRAFAHLRQTLKQLQSNSPELDTLSMGMSGDMEVAIAEGATIVRIGTALFGSRATQQ